MLNFPFQFTAHSQLGKEDIFLPAHSLGAANVDVAVNVGTGNVCVTDTVLHFPDKGTAIELAANYNSLSKDTQPWRIAYGRTLRAMMKEKSLVVVERDGREVTYVFDATTKQYLAKDSGRDHAYLYADSAGFACYDCESKVTDYFDTNGLLQKQVDAAGNVTSYEYQNGELSAILPPSGVRYELTRKNQQILVYLRDKEKTTFLHRYEFDAAHQGLTSESYDGYVTKYQTDANGKLASISQTDDSTLTFAYVVSGENKGKLSSIQPGASKAITLNYAGNSTSVTDTAKGVIQFTLDDKKKPLTIRMQNESTHYQYELDGQINTIKHPDGSEEHFTYQAYGLMKSHEQRDGKTITHQYSEGDKPLLISKKIEAGNEAANTRLIYENNLLRFEISPSGRVTAYQRDKNGLVVQKKQYVQDKWDIATTADLNNLLAWEEKIQALRGEQAYLSDTYQHDHRGQVTRLTQGATSLTTFEHDDYGNTKRQTVSCHPDESLKTDFTYNALRKVTSETHGAGTSLAQCETTTYAANIATHTAANGRQTITETDSQSRVKKLIEKATNEERVHTFEYVDAERAVIHTQPDKLVNLTFFDEQHRQIAQLSPSGALTSHTYLDQVRCQIRTDYAQAVSETDLKQTLSYLAWFSGEEPKLSQERLQAVIKAAATHPDNRTSYMFTGLNGKPQYEIDAAGYITEYRYDLHDHEQHIIQYSAKITDTELQQLLQSASLQRTPDRTLDRIQSSFTDNDGNEIAAQDPNGYITEWKRDAAGRAIEKTVYENKSLIFSNDLQAVRPAINQEKDAITYNFYDDLNQLTTEVDAEGFITAFTYDADGKISKQTRHANKVTDEWLAAHNEAPTPVPSTNDLTTKYTYDALRRLFSKNDSTGKKITYTYNESNQQIAEIHSDEHATEINGDTARGKQNIYDGWGQPRFSANPFVEQQLTLASDDAKKQTIWQHSSDRSVFNETGLLTKKTNATGICITYFYNKDRKPVLAIKPSGAFKTYQYNIFGELLEKRRSYKRLDAASVASLTGGFIDETTQALITSLQNNTKDKVTTYQRDKRGLITHKTNASGYISEYEYNAFKLCDKKRLPVNEKAPSLTVEQKFDLIGNITETTQSSAQTKSIKISKTYGRFNALIEETNALGSHQKNTIDRLGRLTEKQVAAEPGVYMTTLKQTLNALGSPSSITDANQQTTTIDYDVSAGTQLIHHPDGISKTHLATNVFGEITKNEQGYLDENNTFQLLQKECTTHAPDGKVATQWLGNNKSVDNQFNLAGQLESELVHDTARASITYDQDGNIDTRTVQANNQSYKTSYTYNALGQPETVTDPKNVKTTYQYENSANTETKTIDPDGLALITTREYNANKQTLSTSEGDTKDKEQYRTTETIDNNGHKTATTIDPDGLGIKTQFERNEIGLVTKETDPNGHENYLYYDLLGRKKVILNAWNDTHCTAMQYDYTPTGQAKTIRTLAAPIAREAIATAPALSDINTLLDQSASNEDTLTHYLYNANSKEQFKLTLLYRPDLATYEALVEEKQYDAAGREIKTIFYAEPITASDWLTLTNDQITERLQTLDHQKDRIHYRGYDEAGRECFTVDQDGRATAYRHDSAGNTITTIRYKNIISDVGTSFSLKTMQDNVKSSSLDRKEYTVYDDLGQILFTVKPNKHVTAYRYDENGNKTLACDFKNPLTQDITSYDVLVATLKTLVPEKGKDRITEYVHDHANRITDDIEHIVQRSDDEKEEIIVTAKNSYQLDALGNRREHTDKEGHVWKNTFDKAKRMTDTLSPPVAVATPYFVPGAQKQLAYTETTLSINNHTEFDAAGSITCVTEASNTPSARSAYTTYHPNKKIKQTEVKDIDVDDGSSYNTSWDHLNALPVKKQNITTLCFYNTKGKKIAEKNQNGDWSYFAYDSLERKIFSISTDNRVIKYTYSAFNEVKQEHHYDTPLTLDLSSYQQSGVPCSIIASALLPHDNDQIIDYQQDSLGNTTLIESRAVFYYSNGEYGTAKPTIKQRFNTFGDLIYEGKLIRPEVWAEKFHWYDDAGYAIASVDENNYVTRYTLNTVGQPTQTWEVATPLKESPHTYVDNQLISELDKCIISATEDRIYQYEYTAYYLKKTEKLLNVITHTIELDKNSLPHLVEKPPQTLTKRWDRTLFGLEKCYTSESGSKFYTYYNARQHTIAKMQPSFMQATNRVYPLLVYKLNEFAQAVVVQTSPLGHLAHQNPHSYEPHSPADKVAETIVMFDNRGLSMYEQDAEMHLTATTFNPARNESRNLDLLPAWHTVNQTTALKDEWVDVKTDHTLVNFNEKFTYQGAKEGWTSTESAPLAAGQSTAIALPHVAEKRHQYDSANHEIKTGYYIEGHLEEEITRTLTGDGLVKTETDAKHTEGLLRKFDASGHAWYSNENNGGKSIQLCDLLGRTTLRLTSANKDLSQVTYADLSSLLNEDITLVTRAETIMDAVGNAIGIKNPRWFKLKPEKWSQQSFHDRYGNITRTVVGDKVSESIYNKFNKLCLHSEPETSVVNEADELVRLHPKTYYYHDINGNEIAVNDANNYIVFSFYDEAHRLSRKMGSDGVVHDRYTYDANNVVTASAVTGTEWFTIINNKLNQHTKVITPSGQVISHAFFGRRGLISSTDNHGNTILYSPDIFNHVRERILPKGHTTRIVSSLRGDTLFERQSNGASTEFERTFFGVEKKSKDLASRITTTEHNHNMQPTRVSRAAGGWNMMQVVPEYVNRTSANVTVPFWAYKLVQQIAPAEEVIYDYDEFKSLTSIHSVGDKRKTTMGYNDEGLRTELSVYQIEGGQEKLLFACSTLFDEAGLPYKTQNKHLTLSRHYAVYTSEKHYDAVHNYCRAHMELTVPGLFTSCESYMQFLNVAIYRDIAGRILRQAAYSNRLHHEMWFRHENGRRVVEGLCTDDSKQKLETGIDYTLDGLLQTTCEKNGATVKYIYTTNWPNSLKRFLDNQTLERIVEPDANGWPQDAEERIDGFLSSHTKYQTNEVGLPMTQLTNSYTPDKHRQWVAGDHRGYEYLSTINFVLKKASIYRTNDGGQGPMRWAEFLLNTMAEHSDKIGSEDEVEHDENKKEIRYTAHYENLLEGGVPLSKLSIPSGDSKIQDDYRLRQFFRSADGSIEAGYLNHYSLAYVADEKILHLLHQNQHNPSKTMESAIYTPLVAHFPLRLVGERRVDRDIPAGDPLNWFAALPPELGPKPHIVRPNETLTSIAISELGDSQFAGHLGLLNGFLLTDQELKPGMVLQIPKLVATHGKTSESAPYQEFISLILGSLSPTIITPQPKPKKNHVRWFSVVAKMIAIAVIVALAPQFATFILPILNIGITASSLAIASGVSAALGDGLVQAAIDGRVSLAEMLEVGVTAGVGTTLPANVTGPDAVIETALKVGGAAVTTQLVEMQFNLRDKFDIRGVVQQVTAALIASQLKRIAPAEDTFAREAFDATTSTATNSALSYGFYGTPPQYQYMIASAIGSYASQQAIAQLKSVMPEPQTNPAAKEAPTPNQKPPAHSSRFFQPKKSQPTKVPVSNHNAAKDAADQEYFDNILTNMSLPEPDLLGQYKTPNGYKVTSNAPVAQPGAHTPNKTNAFLNGVDTFNANAPYILGAMVATAGAIIFAPPILVTSAAAFTYASLAAIGIPAESVMLVEAVTAGSAVTLLSKGMSKAGELTSKMGLWGRQPTGAESAVNWAAQNQVNRLKLSTELALKEANILNHDGTLTAQALKEAFPAMKRGEALNNPSVISELTKDGSRITDWQKLSTQSIELPTGQRVQAHFYQNRFTGEVNYAHTDFKVKNLVDAFYNPHSPTIVTPQSILNKYRN